MHNGVDDFCVAIIDDDDSFCRSSARMLRAAGFQSATYRSAEEFLADPVHTRFNCLLVDINLGGMTGLEMQGALASEGTGTPIIFITAYDSPQVRTAAQRSGCLAFFSKTDEGALLLDALRRLRLPGRTNGAGAT